MTVPEGAKLQGEDGSCRLVHDERGKEKGMKEGRKRRDMITTQISKSV